MTVGLPDIKATATELWDLSEGGTRGVNLLLDGVEVEFGPRADYLVLQAQELGRVLGRGRLTGTELDPVGMLVHHLTGWLAKR